MKNKKKICIIVAVIACLALVVSITTLIVALLPINGSERILVVGQINENDTVVIVDEKNEQFIYFNNNLKYYNEETKGVANFNFSLYPDFSIEERKLYYKDENSSEIRARAYMQEFTYYNAQGQEIFVDEKGNFISGSFGSTLYVSYKNASQIIKDKIASNMYDLDICGDSYTAPRIHVER